MYSQGGDLRLTPLLLGSPDLDTPTPHPAVGKQWRGRGTPALPPPPASSTAGTGQPDGKFPLSGCFELFSKENLFVFYPRN